MGWPTEDQINNTISHRSRQRNSTNQTAPRNEGASDQDEEINKVKISSFKMGSQKNMPLVSQVSTDKEAKENLVQKLTNPLILLEDGVSCNTS
jgi:hypothetical protein